jgi:hypothetical protein
MNKKNQDTEGSQDRATFANATWQTEQEAGMFLTQEVMEEHVVNNATQAQGLLPPKILLDNVANICVMKPEAAKKCETCREKDQSKRSRRRTDGSRARR